MIRSVILQFGFVRISIALALWLAAGCGAAEGFLPSPWQLSQVGVGVAGSVEYDGTVLRLTGAGASLMHTVRDRVAVVGAPIAGDGEIVAQLQNLESSDGGGMGGIAFRESLEAGSPYVGLAYSREAGLLVATRKKSDKSSATKTIAKPLAANTQTAARGALKLGLPVWLKIIRAGNDFTFSYSTDGATWKSVFKLNMALKTNAFASLMSTGSRNGVACTASFAQVRVTNGSGSDADAASAIPAPWVDQDLGAATTGIASFDAGAFTLVKIGDALGGGGGDGTCKFVNQELAGDGEISARIITVRVQDADGTAVPFPGYAGLMIRARADGPAPFVFLAVSPAGQVRWVLPSGDGAPLGQINFPAYLKLARHGSLFSAAWSVDGSGWTALDETTLDMATATGAGMAATSGDDPRAVLAQFDSVALTPDAGTPETTASLARLTINELGAGETATVTVTGAENRQAFYTLDGSEPDALAIPYTGPIPLTVPATVTVRLLDGNAADELLISATYQAPPQPDAPLEVADAASITSRGGLPYYWAYKHIYPSNPPGGDAGSGSASYSSGTFTLVERGWDIWSGADQFGYIYRPVSGDCSITARVVSMQFTQQWAKAGVMIRENLNADSANSIMHVTANFGLGYQDRSWSGAATGYDYGSNWRAPTWVRVTRTGNVFRGFQSSDGVNWTEVGNGTFSIARDVYIGLATTSNAISATQTAVFDHVTVVPPPPSPTITVTAPVGGETWIGGQSADIKWTSSGPVDTTLAIDLSVDGGTSWNTIAASTPNDGAERITVPATPSTRCRIRIRDASNGAAGASPNNFTIQAPPPTVSVLSPNGGETWTAGGNVSVTWQSSAPLGSVAIELSKDSGATWGALVASADDTGLATLSLPFDAQTTHARVRVRALSGVATDASDADFTILPAPSGIQVSAPNGGETWTQGAGATVRWASAPGVGDVKIDFSSDGGTSWLTLVSQTANDGSESITVPSVESAQCLIRVRAIDGGTSDESDDFFSVIAPTPSLTVLSPDGGETWTAGGSATVAWSSQGPVGSNVVIELSTDNGSSWKALLASTANDGGEGVSVPATPSTACRVRVRSLDGSVAATSAGTFTIRTGAPAVTLQISPGSGTYTSSVLVSISGGGGYVVHYTTNGSAPTETSPVYTGPFTLTSSAVVKAQAFGGGSAVSDLAVASYTVFIPPPGPFITGVRLADVDEPARASNTRLQKVVNSPCRVNFSISTNDAIPSGNVYWYNTLNQTIAHGNGATVDVNAIAGGTSGLFKPDVIVKNAGNVISAGQLANANSSGDPFWKTSGGTIPQPTLELFFPQETGSSETMNAQIQQFSNVFKKLADILHLNKAFIEFGFNHSYRERYVDIPDRPNVGINTRDSYGGFIRLKLETKFYIPAVSWNFGIVKAGVFVQPAVQLDGSLDRGRHLDVVPAEDYLSGRVSLQGFIGMGIGAEAGINDQNKLEVDIRVTPGLGAETELQVRPDPKLIIRWWVGRVVLSGQAKLIVFGWVAASYSLSWKAWDGIGDTYTVNLASQNSGYGGADGVNGPPDSDLTAPVRAYFVRSYADYVRFMHANDVPQSEIMTLAQYNEMRRQVGLQNDAGGPTPAVKSARDAAASDLAGANNAALNAQWQSQFARQDAQNADNADTPKQWQNAVKAAKGAASLAASFAADAASFRDQAASAAATARAKSSKTGPDVDLVNAAAADAAKARDAATAAQNAANTAAAWARSTDGSSAPPTPPPSGGSGGSGGGGGGGHRMLLL